MLALAALLLAATPPALAEMRTVVVPAGAAVVIAPRGQPAPRPSMAPPTGAQRRLTAASGAEIETLNAPAAAAAIGLAGAAALAVMLGGGGGGGVSPSAAPSRTR
jgi:hypothetical protein